MKRNDKINRALGSGDVKDKVLVRVLEMLGAPPELLAAYIKTETAKSRE